MILVRVFVAGGTGVLGRRLVQRLVAGGQVSVGAAVGTAGPELIVHQMTGISVAQAGEPGLQHFDRWQLRYPSWRQGLTEDLA